MSPSEPPTGPTRFVIVGGYLGAGKTRLATTLARFLRDKRGKSVAIITNDQGNVLVDTEFVRNAGFDVREVMGGCFCSNLPEFIKNARSLVQMGRPDVIMAEPIGTSTNILASVLVPLRSMYPNEFDVAPLMVVVDGTRVRELLAEKADPGFGQRKLIPTQQAHDAEIVLVSKTDMMSEGEVNEAIALIRKEVPDAEVLPYSSVSLLNIARIAETITSPISSKKLPDVVDNRLFAVEKASMGWYNVTASLRIEGRLDLYAYITDILRETARKFDAEALAHVKVLVESETVAVKMSLVQDLLQTDGIRGGRYLNGEGRLVLNARVSSSPGELSRIFSETLRSISKSSGVKLSNLQEACFAPKPESPSFLMRE